jgi:hypothetical protein
MKRLALVVLMVVVLAGFSSITATWVWGDHIISTPALTHFLQTDDGWKDKELGIGSGWFMGVNRGGKVMSGCAITAAAMVFKAYGCDVDPGRLCDWANQHGAFDGTTGNVRFPALVGYDPSKVSWSGNEDWRKRPADLDYLRRQIDQDYLPIVEVRKYGGHWIVLCGYQADDFLILDPLGGYAGENFCDKYGDPARDILECRLYIGTIVSNQQQRDEPEPEEPSKQKALQKIGWKKEYQEKGQGVLQRVLEQVAEKPKTDEGPKPSKGNHDEALGAFMSLIYGMLVGKGQPQPMPLPGAGTPQPTQGGLPTVGSGVTQPTVNVTGTWTGVQTVSSIGPLTVTYVLTQKGSEITSIAKAWKQDGVFLAEAQGSGFIVGRTVYFSGGRILKESRSDVTVSGVRFEWEPGPPQVLRGTFMGGPFVLIKKQ